MNIDPFPIGDSESALPTKEGAQRKLEEVRQRYGIRVTDTLVQPVAVKSTVLPERAKQRKRPELQASRTPEPTASRTPLVQVNRLQLRAASKSEAVRRSSGSIQPDSKCFHFLIRIAECASTLHCEVKAETSTVAREQVEQIPNLLEWRETSPEELDQLLRGNVHD
jgi:hypothetical protein